MGIVIHDIFNNQMPNLFSIALEMYNTMILLQGRRQGIQHFNNNYYKVKNYISITFKYHVPIII